MLEDGSSPRPVITAPIRGRDAEQAASRRATPALDAATIVLLPALTVYLGLNAGGYFAGDTGWAAAVLAVALAGRIAVSGGPLANRGWPLAVAGTGLALLATWTLVSASWSEDQGVALLEFDRVLLYLLVLLLFGSLGDPRSALRYLPAGFAVVAVFLCGIGLASRTLPDLWSFAPASDGKLAYPISYSNGLGILASLGVVACLHLASWEREHPVVRLLAAAAIPLLAATLALTSSDGAVVAGAAGAVLYAVLGRPRGLLAALIATAPFVALAVHAAVGADLVAAAEPTTAAAADEGRDLARTVGFAMLASAGALGLLMVLGRRLARADLPRPSRPARVTIALALVIVLAAAVTQLPDAARAIGDELEGTGPGAGDRSAVAVLDGQNRIEYWRVALDAFEEEPITGTGVGTFGERWARERPFPESVDEGHSLYVETLGELGLVGAALLALVLGAITAAFVAFLRGASRPLAAAMLSTAVAWLLHAGIDWDWELPAVTVWIFAFGGCALAAWARREAGPHRTSLRLRIVLTAGCLALAVTPATVAMSQSHLDEAVSALLRYDCARAESLAASASRLVSARAEPYEVLSYCASRRGDHQRAISMMGEAIDRDPDSWELVYGLALVRAAAGRDPRDAIRRTLELNPLEPIANGASERLTGGNSRSWQREAESSPLPLP